MEFFHQLMTSFITADGRQGPGPHAALPEENFGGRPGCGVSRNPAGRRFFDPVSFPLTLGDLTDGSPRSRIFGTHH